MVGFSYAQNASKDPEISFARRAELISLDLGTDGINELAVSAAPQEEPRVTIFRQNGTVINSFLAYDQAFIGGVDIAAGDVTGDSASEIITAPQKDGGAHIRIFDGYGKPLSGFFAFDKEKRYPLFIDTTKDSQIAVLAQDNTSLYLKLFDMLGEEEKSLEITVPENISVDDFAIADLGTDGTEEIIIAQHNDEQSEIAVYRLYDGSFIRRFKPFGDDYRGIININTGDLNHEGINRIIATTGFGSEAQVKVFSGYGDELTKHESFEQGFIGGSLAALINTQAGEVALYSIKQNIPTGDISQNNGNYIEIDRSTQMLTYYIAGFQQDTFNVSTGRKNYETPAGTFAVQNHHERAWSSKYGLWMPYWMAFTPDGSYGIHELPEWPSGYKEGENHLGIPVSHGCVRLGVGPAEQLYNWASDGTPVLIH